MEITDDKWNEIDGNAISDLHLALADGVLSSVAEKNTAKEIWDTLTKLYEAKSLHNKIFLKRKLYTLRMAKSTMVTDHINTLKTLFSQLITLGHNIEENERAELLLQSLPDSHDQLIINLTNNNPVKSLVFDNVAASALNEESRWKNKENRQASSQSIARSKCILDLIHSDVWESPDISMGGAKYMVTFIDDYSRRCWVYPIKKKSDVFTVFKEYKARVERESGKKIKCLKTDNGGEYTDGEFLAFCKQEGIQRQFTVAYTPQQNGVVERMNRTLSERIRAMLRIAGLPNSYWAEVAKTACYIVNWSPSTAIGLKTAMEMWTRKPADYSYLHAFGCPVYVMYNAQERTRLDAKSRRCIFLGYVDGVKGYRLWDTSAHKIVINRDVIFVEDQLQRKDGDDSSVKEKSKTIPVYLENNLEDSNSSEAAPEHEEQEPIESEAPEVHRSTTIGNKWVYKIKRDGNDQVERYRARLVVKGYAQKEGIDFNEIFSPVVRLTTVRIVLAILSSDNCAYYKRFEDNDSIILLLYVDDMLIAGPNKDRIQELKAQLAREFEMKDLGPANKILGIPDIAQAVGAVSRYMANPGGEHWIAVKRILRYIRGTSDVALCYGESEFTVRGYVDSDFARDLDKRKSTTGYVFTLAGAAVSWVSKLQTVVALSTTEAEYMAATQACKEAIWIQRLLEELGHGQEKISVFCDSQSALHFARNPAFHSRTKHIGVQYHFVREVVEDGSVDLQKIHTKENLADVLTKPINTDKFVSSRSSYGLAET
ncbi:hypothetical protein KPL70_026888 [Citrus sinensis]|nr:hypothetical protein KPL70_026888 [Citrus sinensis]